MDNHPIPQDVTNFQFRLIGEMTLKQFAYVASGVVLAWIMLASPVFFLLKFFLAAGSVLCGVVLAFVPVDGRPSDLMALHFLKALFNPTQFTYQKTTTAAQPTTTPMQTGTPQLPKDQKEEKKEEKVTVETFEPTATAAVKARVAEEPTAQPAPAQAVATPPQKQPAQAEPEQEQKMQEEVQHLTEELAEAKAAETHAQQGTAISQEAHIKVIDLEQQLQDMQLQKQELEKQLVALQKSLSEKKEQVFQPTAIKEPPKQTQHVKQVPKQMSASVGTPFVPDVPNLLTGIVKDPRGNVLGNILIEVKDKDGNPVRAFKTNQLGQFAAATPLANGIYTISFEDPAGKHSFDTVELTAQGEILMPMVVTSVDAREKLRQELFGGAT